MTVSLMRCEHCGKDTHLIVQALQVCKQRRIPVIYDEVFTGFYRLGWQSGADMLGITPDVGCYAKLLTAGVVPLAVTLASSPIFDAFKGDSKLQALLHGHSYTAYPAGKII